MRSCPDPFVLEYQSEYWCYCTGLQEDGRCFSILHSADLVSWEARGSAMDPLPGGHPAYWAPEVTYQDGQFLMYYSVGDGDRMQIRVALSDSPEGPFSDSGRRLTMEEFAIDPHVFDDGPGRRFLFYATDFLQHTHIGTGTVRDRLLDPFTLEGHPRSVTRALYGWQVFDPARAERGGVRWHTVEGPFVLAHKGRFYQMFSGGNWQKGTYGIGYGITTSLEEESEWSQRVDGERVPPILTTIPGRVVGPGHNSVVRGPDNRQMYCIYHHWTEDSKTRVLAIDRMEWVGERLMVIGPTTTPQPAPIPPTLGALRRSVGIGEEAELTIPEGSFVLEMGMRCVGSGVGGSRADRPPSSGRLSSAHTGAVLAVRFLARSEPLLELEIGEPEPVSGDGFGPATIELMAAGDTKRRSELDAAFHLRHVHGLRVEQSGRIVTLALDGARWRARTRIPRPPDRIMVHGVRTLVELDAFTLTTGWEDLFDDPAIGLEDLDWLLHPPGSWAIVSGELLYRPQEDRVGGSVGRAFKKDVLEDCEIVVNCRLDGERGASSVTGRYGFSPATDPRGEELRLMLDRRDGRWMLTSASRTDEDLPLPEDFDPFVAQQFRFLRRGRSLGIQWESTRIGHLACAPGAAPVGLLASGPGVSFEMVRATAVSGRVPGEGAAP